jgi:hypothetical protein
MSNGAPTSDGRMRLSDFGVPSEFVIRHSDLAIWFVENSLALAAASL